MSTYGYVPPLTQVGVEERIVAISDAMELAVEDLARYSEEAAEAEVAYKVGYASAILQAGMQAGNGRSGKMTEGDKDATATVECEDLLRKRLITEAHKEVGQERMRTMRARLDSLRTVSANIRAQT